MDVFGKPQDFKESKDANVRVEVHRLRKRLAEFYEHEGTGRRIRIVIPTGQYLPQFLFHEDAPVAGTEAGVDSNTETHSEGIDAGLPLDAKRYAEPPTLPAEPSSDQEPALVAAPSSQAGQRVWRGIARAAVLALVLAGVYCQLQRP